MLATRRFPSVDCAVAVGGSAASLRRLVGDALDADSLHRALDALCGGPCAQVAASSTLDPERVRLLPAGIVILDVAAGQLGRPLADRPRRAARGALLDMARGR